MLSETLGILIGYITVILLFSLMVTSLTQAAQQLLNVRSSLLRGNIEWLIKELQKKQITVPSLPAGAVPPNPKAIAKDVVGSEVTWLERDELLEDLNQRSVNVDPSKTKEFDVQFAVMSRYASKEFEGRMKAVAMVFAFALAILFQLDTFALLKRLSTEPELREGLEAVARSRVKAGEQAKEAVSAFEVVAPEAIAQYKARHPELEETLDPMSGIGADREALEKELRELLMEKSVPNADKLVAEYGEIVDELHRKKASDHLATVQGQVDQLALYDITIWPKGREFFTSWNACLGVLVSAVLISLGAPFWFNTLKNLLNLRDMLKPRQRDAT